MAQRMELLKCDKCGQLAMVFNSGPGTLQCCSQPMRLLHENTTDAAKEKHVPVIERVDGGVRVKVGSVPHPMEEKHWIQWIELLADERIYCKFLNPGDAPEAVFPNVAETAALSAREHCNLHGYWKGELR